MLVKVQLGKFGRTEMRLKDDLLTFLSKEKAKSFFAKYPELESQRYDWISVIRKASLPISPSTIIAKANKIANSLSFEDFKVSWK